jgi:RNA polymerase sigma factor (sigma-70 family)
VGELSPPARRRRFEELYTGFYQPITGYVRRRLAADGSEADDVVAEIFVVAWRRLESIPLPPDDRLWLYGVARRITAQSRRTRWRQGRLFDRVAREPVPQGPPTEDPVHDRVRAVVASLRRRDREVLELVFWDRLSHAEIAALLGCSENAVALRLRRAKDRVVKSLVVSSPALPSPNARIQKPMNCASLEVERIVP